MQYDPIKKSIGRFFSGPVIMRKILYLLLDLLLLRAWHVKKALKKISRQLPDQATVLDAGSGFGQYTWQMSRMKAGWKINGIDIDSDHVKDCSVFFEKAGLSGRVSFKSGDLTSLSDTGLYDLILSVDVMEHIEDDIRVFRNFFSSLKNNGILLISTPSDRGGSDVHDDKEESFIDEHVRDGYSKYEIREKLSDAGFKSIDTSYTYGKPGNISWRLSMKYPIRMLNFSKLFFIILPFYYLICFPIAVILNFIDLFLTHNTGTGLIVIARK
jgi:2-polyprenyl-3-methyl-5-hydroxy-6-metoxy-1,4-benzoquinol methylase